MRKMKNCFSRVGDIRGVHGSVRFGLDSKNQPNRITVLLQKMNRTEPVRFG